MKWLFDLLRGDYALAPASSPEPILQAVVAPSWLPSAEMKRIVLHWTAGSYEASALDREHYHFLVDGDGNFLRGLHSVKANESLIGKTSDEYAAHTRRLNTGSIGIGICACAGAQERPFRPGRYPLTEIQWSSAKRLIALLAETYDIPVTPETILTHAEVQSTLGVRQNGKWDIAKLSFDPMLKTAARCGDDLREGVRASMT